MTPKQARVTILGNLAVWNVNGIIDQLESGYEKGVLREIVGAAEQLAKSTGWISVKDRLPNETGYVIAGSANHQWSRQSYFDGWDFRVEPDRVIVGRVTHWMPLPEPPEVAQ